MDRGYDTRSPIQKTSSLPKTFALFRTYIILVLLIFFLALFFVFAYAPVFTIRNVQVSGSTITPNSGIEAYVAKVLEGSWKTVIPHYSTIGIPVSTLQESILKTFPSVESVFVDRVGISDLHVFVTERVPQSIFCKENACTLLDSKSTIFGVTERNGYEIIEGNPAEFVRRGATTTKDVVVFGEKLFPQVYQETLDATRNFLYMNNFTVKRIYLAPLGFFDVHAVSLSSNAQVEFRFRANKKIDKQLYELRLAFEKGLRQKINDGNVEYVISYVPQKVIYKNTEVQK